MIQQNSWSQFQLYKQKLKKQRLAIWLCYPHHHYFFKYLTPCLSGKSDSALFQTRSSESDLDAEVRNLTTTQNKGSELSSKGI